MIVRGLLFTLLAGSGLICQAQFPATFNKISATQGGLGLSLSPDAKFGIKADAIGDINNDGVTDIAVGATNQGGFTRGSFFVILLKPNGEVLQAVEHPAPEAPEMDSFGSAVAGIGDLDNDGVEDVAVGGGYDNQDGGIRGAIWIYFLNSSGTMKSRTKINTVTGNFTGSLDPESNFGTGMAGLGDLDGDGVEDIAVGADRDNGTGAVFILFMNTNGTVKSHTEIGNGMSGFPVVLNFEDYFGYGLGNIGDLDGDGVTDLGVGAHRTDDGGVNRGAVHIVFLNTNGTVKNRAKISALAGGFIQSYTALGVSLTGIGDMDGDGVRDIIVGSNDNNNDGGVVWYLMMNVNGTVKSFHKISDSSGSTNLALDPGDFFGCSTLFLGDINNDGLKDIAVGAFNDDDGNTDTGAMWISGVCSGESHAGPDQVICGTSQAVLAADTPGLTGTWVLIQGSGTITAPSMPNTTVTNMGFGASRFVWDIGPSACIRRDTVTVQNDIPPIASVASEDISTCTGVATLVANPPNRGTGTWETTPGAAIIQSPQSLSTTVQILSGGPVVFRWLVSAPGCPSAEDIATVSPISPPVASVVADSVGTCTGQAQLLALAPAFGKGLWESDDGTATIQFPDSLSTGVGLVTRQPAVFRWKVTAEGCPSSEAEVTVYPFDITEEDIPNVITPNGDGANDSWKILGRKKLTASVFIYNRWGAPVLESQRYDNSWSGANLSAGTYYYTLWVDGCTEEFKGNIQVIR